MAAVMQALVERRLDTCHVIKLINRLLEAALSFNCISTYGNDAGLRNYLAGQAEDPISEK